MTFPEVYIDTSFHDDNWVLLEQNSDCILKKEINIIVQLALGLCYGTCAGTLAIRYKRALKNRVKMVLAIYDVCVEKEICEGNIVY